MIRNPSRRASIALAAAASAALGMPPSASAGVEPVHEGVRLVVPATPRAKPDHRSRARRRIEPTTPATGREVVLPVISRKAYASGERWVQVRLWQRPNGTTGWIPASVTRAKPLDWRIHVSVGKRLATVYRGGAVVRRFRVVVGSRRTPTPLGRHFIVERVKLHEPWSSGTWALATSAHSDVHMTFEGGDGQVALHAKGSLSARLGSAASNGCIRIADGTMAWLAGRIPRGTPLDVTR